MKTSKFWLGLLAPAFFLCAQEDIRVPLGLLPIQWPADNPYSKQRSNSGGYCTSISACRPTVRSRVPIAIIRSLLSRTENRSRRGSRGRKADGALQRFSTAPTVWLNSGMAVQRRWRSRLRDPWRIRLKWEIPTKPL